jgi:ubiquinol-cytochrome c reductase cytochrome b subunit
MSEEKEPAARDQAAKKKAAEQAVEETDPQAALETVNDDAGMPGDEEAPTSTVKTAADADSPVVSSDVVARRSLHASFIAWLDSRTGILGLAHEMLFERIPGGSRWRYVWGSTLVFAFVVQAITGTVLWMHYSPSDTTAWESVQYIENQMQAGWLLRGIHHFMAQCMVVLLALHMLQVVIDGAYKAPREINFWLGLILMQIVLGLSLTGYLLPWDQKGYWATRVATNLMGLVPLVGEQLQALVVGGSDYNHHTVTRFFALHAGLLPAMLVVFVAAHVAVFRRHGIAAKLPLKRPDQYFWPDQILKDGIACLAVMAVALGLTIYFGGAELTAPADGAREYSAARPEWYFLFLFQFLKLFEGWGAAGEFVGAIAIPGLVVAYLFAMPFVARFHNGHLVNVAVLLLLLAGAGALTFFAVHEDQNDPAYLNAVWVAHEEAKLAEHKADQEGIPLAGMRAKLRQDPQHLALQVLANDCLKCHNYKPPDGKGHYLADATASNLYGFGTAEWARGLLDAESFLSPEYFGSTVKVVTKGDAVTKQQIFKGKEMHSFLKDPERGGKFSADDRQKIAEALAAEADDQRKNKDKDKRLDIFGTHGCTECHKYHTQEGGGLAPTLDGWGSTEWLMGMIGDPGSEQFYGHLGEDQQMPAFESLLEKRLKENPATKDVAPKEVIREIARWLRGEWYVEPKPE